MSDFMEDVLERECNKTYNVEKTVRLVITELMKYDKETLRYMDHLDNVLSVQIYDLAKDGNLIGLSFWRIRKLIEWRLTIWEKPSNSLLNILEMILKRYNNRIKKYIVNCNVGINQFRNGVPPFLRWTNCHQSGYDEYPKYRVEWKLQIICVDIICNNKANGQVQQVANQVLQMILVF